MRITPLTAHIGAAIEDIDITTPLDETTRTSLRAALCRRAVLLVGRCCAVRELDEMWWRRRGQ